MRTSLGNLSPSRMMLLSEQRAATKLVRKLHRLRERRRVTNWGEDLAPAKQSALTNSIRAAEEDLEALASSVLARQLGLKRYTVVHVRREGGYEDRFQLLFARIELNNFRLVWHLRGRSLRKNGTLGEQPGGMCIDAGSVSRRMLDGTWAQLQPRYTESE